MQLLQMVQQRTAVVPGGAGRTRDDVVATERRDRDRGDVDDLELRREMPELLLDLLEDLPVEVDEVHLVHAQHQVRNLQQGGEEGVPAGLFDHTLTGVDEQQREVRGRGAGDHVAGVLHVPGRVGEDERPPGGREVAVGDIDGDALLTFGAQAVGEQRQVDVAVAAFPTGPLDRRQLVGEQGLRVVEQPADQRRLAVVDGSGGRHAQQLGHQKYPSRLRSSMAASLTRSSARVAPRSVILVAATSTMTSSGVRAVDSTAPVQVMSPTVR